MSQNHEQLNIKESLLRSMRSYKFRDSLEVVFINTPEKDQDDKTKIFNNTIGNYLSNTKGLEAWSEILYDTKNDEVLSVKDGELS